jgi:hypothetical protein
MFETEDTEMADPLNELLASWKTLNDGMKELREDQVRALLYAEIDGAKRQDVLARLHQRYTALRSKRERYELMTTGRLL